MSAPGVAGITWSPDGTRLATVRGERRTSVGCRLGAGFGHISALAIARATKAPFWGGPVLTRRLTVAGLGGPSPWTVG